VKGYELVRKIEEEKSAFPDHIFIKWWRKEEDFIDFDLVARFLENLDYACDISGFDLIDKDEMWKTVASRTKGLEVKVQPNGSWILLWTDQAGTETEITCAECPYTPDTLLKILDAETKDNYVD
jgi:hypothetical protein